MTFVVQRAQPPLVEFEKAFVVRFLCRRRQPDRTVACRNARSAPRRHRRRRPADPRRRVAAEQQRSRAVGDRAAGVRSRCDAVGQEPHVNGRSRWTPTTKSDPGQAGLPAAPGATYASSFAGSNASIERNKAARVGVGTRYAATTRLAWRAVWSDRARSRRDSAGAQSSQAYGHSRRPRSHWAGAVARARMTVEAAGTGRAPSLSPISARPDDALAVLRPGAWKAVRTRGYSRVAGGCCLNDEPSSAGWGDADARDPGLPLRRPPPRDLGQVARRRGGTAKTEIAEGDGNREANTRRRGIRSLDKSRAPSSRCL